MTARARRCSALAVAALLLAGCAPLEPESRRSPSPSPSPEPSAAAEPSSPTPSSPSPARSRTPVTRPPSPAITVPESLRNRRPSGPVLGGDVSWPQCPKGMGIPQKKSLGIPMPLPTAKFVIIGLTNGPAFTPNPCLADQVQWVRDRHLMAAAYAVTSYPDDRTLARYRNDGPFDGSTQLGALANVGYQQARYNVANMRRAGLLSPVVWIDVEPVSLFEWSNDPVANSAVVRGVARGYTDLGYRIGTYSTQALWSTVVGDLRLGLPEWRAAGQTSRAEALRRCGPARMYQGGPGVLSQWVEDNRDQNITCPGTSADMLRWFHQY